jgi:hypothetical protein
MSGERKQGRLHGRGLPFPFIGILFSKRSLVRLQDAMDQEKGGATTQQGNGGPQRLLTEKRGQARGQE